MPKSQDDEDWHAGEWEDAEMTGMESIKEPMKETQRELVRATDTF